MSRSLPIFHFSSDLAPRTSLLAQRRNSLSEFLRRHRRAINDVFTQVVQMARRAGLGRLVHLAIDWTRVGANAARRSVVDWEQARRQQWAPDAEVHQKASAQDPEEDGGVSLSVEQQQALERQIVPALPKEGRQQVSLTDPDSRFLRTAQGCELGYTADLAVSRSPVRGGTSHAERDR